MIGKEIGNYRILKELGRGGMGVVYKANQLSLSRMVAMKVLPQHLIKDPAFIKRFQNEARAIAKLNHPNIVQIFDIGNEGEIHYYTMEFIEGPALDEIVQKEGSLSHDTAINIIEQIAAALQYAHSKGIVHRDIKPSNIMMDASGRVKITDFGLALQQRTTRLTVIGDIVGTPEYMSPEQATGQQATVRSDIYSLGVVFFEMLTGKVPFEGSTPLIVLNKIKASEPQWPCSINAAIPPEVEKITRKMMAKNPRDRYGSCQEIIQDILLLKTDQPISMQNRRKSALRKSARTVAGITLLGLIAGGILFSLKADRTEPTSIKGFLNLQQQPDISAISELAALRLSTPISSQPEVLDKIRQELALLEGEFKNIQKNYRDGRIASSRDGFTKIAPELVLIKDQFKSIRASMYPDILLLKQGNEIRGRISNESIEKVHVETSLGPKTEINRTQIRFIVYATRDEREIAETLSSDAPEIERRIRDLTTAAAGMEEELEAGYESEPLDHGADAGQRAENMENIRETSFQVKLVEQGWDVEYNNCGEGATHSFIDNVISISTNNPGGDFACAVTAATTEAGDGIADSIEIVVQVQHGTTSKRTLASSSIVITFLGGASIEYYFYDSRADYYDDVEEFQTTDGIVIRRAHNLIPPNEDWKRLILPVAEDTVRIGGSQAITAITLVHKHTGADEGPFVSRCRSIVVNMK